jgi:hypothetical protein
MVRLLQIKLMQEAITEIDRKINIDKTIKELHADLKFYKQDAKSAVSTKNKSNAKKQNNKIDEAAAKVTGELAYYQALKLENSPEIAPEKLKEDKNILITKLKELESLGKLSEARYLQEKGLDPDNIIKRSVIVKIYQEMDAIKEKLDKLNNRLEALEKGDH